MTRLQQLGKDSLIYGFGGVVAKGIGFFLLPIYTRIFSPSDYGTIEMLAVLAGFIGALLVMGMDTAQSFYFFREQHEGKAAQARVVSAILQWRLTWGVAIVVLSTLAAPVLNVLVFEGRLDWRYFAIAFAGTFFGQVMGQSAEVFRLLYRPWSYIILTLSQSLGAATLVLVFVVVLDQGIWGYFLGSLLASLCAAVFGWFLVREYLDFSLWHTDWWPSLLRFGAPLLPASLAYYGMSTTDRWFIQHYHGSGDLGVYAVGAKFSLLMMLVVETFRKAWWPIAMDAMHSEDGPATFRIISRLYIGFGVAGVVILTWISPLIIPWLIGSDFHDAWPLVGILSWASLLYGFHMISSRGILKAEKTYILALLMVLAMIVNLFLNWLLVPSYGGTGAAVATVLAYMVWVGMSMFVSECFWRVGFPVRIIAGQIAVGLLYVVWFLTTYEYLNLNMHAPIVILTVLSLLASSLDSNQRRYVYRRIKLLWKK